MTAQDVTIKAEHTHARQLQDLATYLQCEELSEPENIILLRLVANAIETQTKPDLPTLPGAVVRLSGGVLAQLVNTNEGSLWYAGPLRWVADVYVKDKWTGEILAPGVEVDQ